MKTRTKYSERSGYTIPVIITREIGCEVQTQFTTAEEKNRACMVCFPRIFTAEAGIVRTFRKLVVPPTGGVMIETTGTGFAMPLLQYFPHAYVLDADRRWSELMNQYSNDPRWVALD